ncbi:hypothetical protein BDN71DRAFT_1594623 [Pleurotus eryngii]|uniref:Uncharacterized protein n=1 Tax=Pleurotus eryngii TaxID=5323 RepID=A0A9P5ZF72_PLEER|nr:hypothetical protein BDN71DRAFT_1594623 [Pleurotus eryngii]
MRTRHRLFPASTYAAFNIDQGLLTTCPADLPLYHTPGDICKFGARYQSTGIMTGLAIALRWEDAPVSVPLVARKYLSDLQYGKYVLPTPRVPVLRARLDQAGGRHPSRLIFQCASSSFIPTFSTLRDELLLTHLQIADALLELNRPSAPDAAFDVVKPVIHNRNWYHNPEKRKIQTLGYLIRRYRSRPGFANRRDHIYGLRRRYPRH